MELKPTGKPSEIKTNEQKLLVTKENRLKSPLDRNFVFFPYLLLLTAPGQGTG